MTEALGHIDRICFDFDGVLYTPPPGQNIFECANNVMGKLFEACHRRVPLKDCITMAHDGMFQMKEIASVFSLIGQRKTALRYSCLSQKFI